MKAIESLAVLTGEVRGTEELTLENHHPPGGPGSESKEQGIQKEIVPVSHRNAS